MGLFDKIFGKRGPSSSSAPEAPVNEAAELCNQNLIFQKLVESLQAKVALVRSEAVIAVPIQPVSTELSEHPSIHVPASHLPANESVGVGAQEQNELTVAMREKVEWVEADLASAVRKAAVLRLAN